MKRKLGDGCEKLVQAYAVHKTLALARNRGWLATRHQLPNGSVKVTISGSGL